MLEQIRPKTIKGKVVSNKLISERVTHTKVLFDEELKFYSGQFGWLSFERNGELLRKPYSIACAPWEKELDFCVTKVEGGKVSSAIHELQVDDKVSFLAPLGVFVLPKEDSYEHIMFVCAGSGIAPFRSMVRDLFGKHFGSNGEDTTKKVSLLFGTRDSSSVIYEDEFRGLKDACSNFLYNVSLSREEKEGYLKGYVQDHLETVIREKKGMKIYICGLSEMTREVKKKLLDMGFENRQLHVEIYT